MSLEDKFHNTYHNNCSLVAKFKVDHNYILNIKNNILSDRFLQVLKSINTHYPEFENYTQRDILDNKHPLFYNDISGNVFNLHINHCFVGGSILVRLIESIIQSNKRELPSTNIYKGLFYGIYNIKDVYKFLRAKPNPINIDNTYYYTKYQTLFKIKNISRLDLAYFTVFNDALIALNKDTIRVGLPIPFDNSHCINNVGILILEYNKNINLYDLSKLIKEKIGLVYTSNVYNLYGKTISNITRLDNYSGRQKLDLICSSYVSDNKAMPGEFYLQPKGQIYEGAYMSIYLRLMGDKKRSELYTSVTTNCKSQQWKNVKYINSVINSI